RRERIRRRAARLRRVRVRGRPSACCARDDHEHTHHQSSTTHRPKCTLRRVRRLVTALAIAVVLVGFVSASPASAANRHEPWAGWHMVDDDGFTTATATVEVPQFSCPAQGTVDHMVSLGWVADSPFVAGGLRLDVHCASGLLTLSARAAINDALANPVPNEAF